VRCVHSPAWVVPTLCVCVSRRLTTEDVCGYRYVDGLGEVELRLFVYLCTGQVSLAPSQTVRVYPAAPTATAVVVPTAGQLLVPLVATAEAAAAAFDAALAAAAR
jgi:hypothetical protein